MSRFTPRTHTLAGAVRAHFGLSQTDLARLLGCRQPAVAREEAGTHRLPPGPPPAYWPWGPSWTPLPLRLPPLTRLLRRRPRPWPRCTPAWPPAATS